MSSAASTSSHADLRRQLLRLCGDYARASSCPANRDVKLLAATANYGLSVAGLGRGQVPGLVIIDSWPLSP